MYQKVVHRKYSEFVYIYRLDHSLMNDQKSELLLLLHLDDCLPP